MKYQLIILIIVLFIFSSCDQRYEAICFSDKCIVLDKKTGETWVTEEFQPIWGAKKIGLIPVRYLYRQEEDFFYSSKDAKSNQHLCWFEYISRKIFENKQNGE